jgi:hypothetical protein
MSVEVSEMKVAAMVEGAEEVSSQHAAAMRPATGRRGVLSDRRRIDAS